MINQTIAPYKKTSKLGQGGMGALVKGQKDRCTKAEYTHQVPSSNLHCLQDPIVFQESRYE
jgi:hypothetical protein